MYHINYFGNSEVSEFDKWKNIFKHGSQSLNSKCGIKEKKIYL